MAIISAQADSNRIVHLMPLIQSWRYKKYQFIRPIPPAAIDRYYEAKLTELAADDDAAVFVSEADGVLSGVLAIHRLEWDSEVLKIPCGRIFCLILPHEFGTGYETGQSLLATAVGWARNRGFHFVDARCATDDLPSCHACEAAGFRLMDASLNFAYTPRTIDRWAASGLRLAAEIRLGGEADLSFVRRSATLFRNDRFHRDPRIPRESADRLY